MNVKKNMSEDLARKILGKKEYAEQYLLELFQIKKITLKIKTVSRGANKGEVRLNCTTKEIWEKVVAEWDYDSALKIVRKLFRTTEKYKNGKSANDAMDILIKEWNELKLDEIESLRVHSPPLAA